MSTTSSDGHPVKAARTWHRRARSLPARALARASGCLWPPAVEGDPSPNRDKIALLVLIVAAGFFAAVAYHYVMGLYLGRAWPANSFLYVPEDRFLDFKLVVRQSAGLDPFGQDIGGFAGAPFTQLVAYLFSLVRPAWLQLPLFFAAFFVVFLPMVKRLLCGPGVKLTYHHLPALFVMAFLTYPVLFAFDRANFDLLVCVSIFLFAFMYQGERYRASAAFMALAIALKPYAIVLAAVYLFHRRYRDLALVILGALLLSALSLALFKDGLLVEAQKYLSALSQTGTNLSGGAAQNYTSDLYGFLTAVIKVVGNALGIDRAGTTMYLPAHPLATTLYGLGAILAFLYFAIHLHRQPRPLWKVLAVLTILLVLLPYNSGDYRLTYLLMPLMMYLAVTERTPHDLLIVVLWGLLLVPKNYLTLDLAPPDYYPHALHQHIGIIINPLLLVALLVSIAPEAFTLKGVASSLRSVAGTLRAPGRRARLENLPPG